MERLVRLQLLNQEFSFQTSLSDDDLTEIIAMVRLEIDQLGGPRGQVMPTGKTLVLVCLQMAARLVTLRREYDEYRCRQDHRIDDIIHLVNENIEKK
ncbi:MAG: hypothetical protein BWK76_05830 [Desulfobulbaceae bacterium A2]|nr:MAG: hypothetical protein BWK76_05830 [Desulfobulbaceae bacterium A2]